MYIHLSVHTSIEGLFVSIIKMLLLLKKDVVMVDDGVYVGGCVCKLCLC